MGRLNIKRRATVLLVTALASIALASLGSARGQQVHRNGFETRELGWKQAAADAPFRVLVHEITEETAHSGQRSEHIRLQTESGSKIEYHYPVGKAPLVDELSASVWIKANRPGVRLQARLVLPRERNPKQLDAPLTVMVTGDVYHSTGRWQRLELRQPMKLAREKQQQLRNELQRDVNLADAFFDVLVLNLYCGPGMLDVWIDDLEVGPIDDSSLFRPASRNLATAAGPSGLFEKKSSAGILSSAAPVQLRGNRLLVGGQPFFPRAIRYSDTPLQIFRDARINTIWFDPGTPMTKINEAVSHGFWIIPALPILPQNQQESNAAELAKTIASLQQLEAVLCYQLGSGGQTVEQARPVEHTARLVRSVDPQTLLAANVWDGYQPYARTVNLLGVHRWPLLTGLELSQYRDWLKQRRLLSQPPNNFLWTWVQTHLPDWYTQLVYDRPGSASFAEPIGPQPEQIRLLTYIALGTGCRGLGYWSDRFLADSHQGRDRLLQIALLNMEIQMMEPLLVTADTPKWIDTNIADVKAAVMHAERGILVLPVWLGRGAQFVPGQAAVSNLTILVPRVPSSMQAWQVSPGAVRSLKGERVPGGTRITVPEFGLTSAIVFTSDNGPNGLLVRLQSQVKRMSQMAAQWSYFLAEEELKKVTKINTELEQAGHAQPDGQALLRNARVRLQSSADHWNNRNYAEAYAEAERCLRPLRILMRAHWDKAIKQLDLPVASPYAVSFFTLPRHWQFMAQLKQGVPGPNVLPGGDFETPPDKTPDGWIPQQPEPLDKVELAARRVTDNPKVGNQCLMLEIKPRTPLATSGSPPPAPAALERTFLAINSPSVRLDPGTPVRISGWIRIPKPITASVDGALFYDSAGGEPLAVRLTQPTGWKKFTLYRKVPASGTVNVTLALTGIGSVYFDDIRIEPLTWSSTAASETKR